MSNSDTFYRLIELSQDEWSGKDVGVSLTGSKNNKHDRNDSPSDLKFVETMISNWFEYNRRVLVSINEIINLFPDLNHNQKESLKNVIKTALGKYTLNKPSEQSKNNNVKFELNLDSFNNVLFCSGVKFAQLIGNPSNPHNQYLSNSKSIFAKYVHPHQILSILQKDKSQIKDLSIHIKIIGLLHSKKKFVDTLSLVKFTGSNCLGEIEGIFEREISKKFFEETQWFRQVPKDDILYVMNLKYYGKGVYKIRGCDDEEIKNITDWVNFMRTNYFCDEEQQYDAKKIFAYLFFSVLFLEWSGDKKSLNRLTKSFNIEKDEWKCIEQTLKNSLELKCICSSVMCQASGANMSTNYAKRADVGHRLASNHLLLLLNELDSVLVNNLALGDSGVENRDVNQWHLTRYVPFFGSKLWGNWYIKDNITTKNNNKRAAVFKELSNIGESVENMSKGKNVENMSNGNSENMSKGKSENMSKGKSENMSKGMSENMSKGKSENMSKGMSENMSNGKNVEKNDFKKTKTRIKEWFKSRSPKQYNFIGPPYPKLTIPPYDIFISGYVDKLTRVLKYNHCHSFNWIGREGGLPFVPCIECGEPVVFDKINKQNGVKFYDIFSFGDDKKLSWFLPFLAIGHADCESWNDDEFSPTDQKECWSMLKSFWKIFTDGTKDHYELYYEASDYKYTSKENRKKKLNNTKEKYRRRNTSTCKTKESNT